MFLGCDADAPLLRVRDVPPRERGGIIYDEIFVRPGFAEGLTLRLWAGDGRFVGTVATNVVGTSQPDDLAVDLLEMLAPRLGALLDPVPQLWPATADLAAGDADGRVREESAIVLLGDRVLSVSLRAGQHGALLLHRDIPAPFGLSVRELQILHSLGDGATNRVLAARFGITPRTVATYVERLLVKTGCPNRTAATAPAARLNLTVHPP